MKKEKPFYPMQCLVHASAYLRGQTRTRGVQTGIWYIEAAISKLEISILREMIDANRRRKNGGVWRS